MKIFLISDYLPDEVTGGCEINDKELANLLRKKGHFVVQKKSAFVDQQFIFENRKQNFIVSNFEQLLDPAREALKRCNYVLYEHDHKYLESRDPARYENFKVPSEELINLDFYRKAQQVFCQSDFHLGIVQQNTALTNLSNISGNLWSEESLSLMEEIAEEGKEDCAAILDSGEHHKNTLGALKYCQHLKREHVLVSSSDYHRFLRTLGRNNELVFFPQTPETLSRIICEARMMNMAVTTNNLVGATKEPWFSLKGKELIAEMRTRHSQIPALVESALRGEHANTL